MSWSSAAFSTPGLLECRASRGVGETGRRTSRSHAVLSTFPQNEAGLLNLSLYAITSSQQRVSDGEGIGRVVKMDTPRPVVRQVSMSPKVVVRIYVFTVLAGEIGRPVGMR